MTFRMLGDRHFRVIFQRNETSKNFGSCGELFDQVGRGRSSHKNQGENVLNFFKRNILALFRVPTLVILDNDTQFTNRKSQD
ncbi:hypothetical protein MTR_1g047560 [Medicago truncatula]|uniref:Uncharacterized protein n=1 Tax=Medicago truncatula TaxID=3880 RepID=A0A072VGU6_MEDTR|nr:hypothetical protein MTR_1g047560 [Medicago truncatula]